ncbi:hypothetical protein F5I97DRAFT_1939681 [Phlebopus sp. FC_14]|nr:hypothetical protein F5I97DRAFT_1939681 [Phlebopus sp. FC_14]
MGRRKIEIQPITHERNRSVTFLKRKNGLFKKAYELGVLCSVDVAVIIFEERAGHHLKLYQYCSGDIHDIVQRHIRYDGEKDTRAPHDFANNTNTKLEDNADGDDDEVDDDDPDAIPSRGAGAKKRTEPKLKQDHANSNDKLLISPPTGNDLGVNVEVGVFSPTRVCIHALVSQMHDYHLHRPMTIPPPPMPLHHPSQLTSGGSGAGPTLPLSTERTSSSGRSLLPHGPLSSSQKKPRLAPNITTSSKLHSDDAIYNGYLPSPTSAAPSSAYRHTGGNSTGQQHPLSYNSYLGVGVGVSSPPPPPPAFPSSPFDFSASSSSSSASRNGAAPPRIYQHQHPHPAPHHPLMRSHPHAHPHAHAHANAHSSPGLLSSFLDQDEHEHHGGHHRQGGSAQFGPMDWPTHGGQQQGHAAAAAGPGAAGASSGASGGPPPPGSGDTSWLDFLSHNTTHPHLGIPPPPSAAAAAAAPPPSSSSSASSLPQAQGAGSGAGLLGSTGSLAARERHNERERERDADHLAPLPPSATSERGAGGDKPGTSAHASPPTRKRPRTSSGVDEGKVGRRGSPPGVRGAGDLKGKKEE